MLFASDLLLLGWRCASFVQYSNDVSKVNFARFRNLLQLRSLLEMVRNSNVVIAKKRLFAVFIATA